MKKTRLQLQKSRVLRGFLSAICTILWISTVAIGHTEVSASLSLPSGVSIQTATPEQLATAVKAAIAKNPGNAKTIVSHTVAVLAATKNQGIPQRPAPQSKGALVLKVLVKPGQSVKAGQVIALLEVDGKQQQLKASLDGTITSLDDKVGTIISGTGNLCEIVPTGFSPEASIRAVITAAIASLPSSEVPTIVAAACASAPGYAAVIIQTAVTLVPTQAVAIVQAAVRAVPSLATTIVSAAIAAAPDQASSLSAAANQALQLSSRQSGGQGALQGETDASTLQTEGINPANTINPVPSSTPPPPAIRSNPSPTPNPVSPHE